MKPNDLVNKLLGEAEDVELVVDGEFLSVREQGTGELVPLIVHYRDGDVDAITWPNPDEKNLASALFDLREMGTIPDVKVVKLPDGSAFVIDRPPIDWPKEVKSPAGSPPGSAHPSTPNYDDDEDENNDREETARAFRKTGLSDDFYSEWLANRKL